MRLREVGRIAQVTGWYEPRLETEEIWLWELDIRPLAPLPHLRKPQPRLGYAKDGARQGGEDRSRGKHRAGFVGCRQRSHSDTVFTLTSWRRRHGGGHKAQLARVGGQLSGTKESDCSQRSQSFRHDSVPTMQGHVGPHPACSTRLWGDGFHDTLLEFECNSVLSSTHPACFSQVLSLYLQYGRAEQSFIHSGHGHWTPICVDIWEPNDGIIWQASIYPFKKLPDCFPRWLWHPVLFSL